MRLRCTNCEASFEGDKDARCPKCLRLTSVVEHTGDASRGAGSSAVAPWPAGTTCSLCLARPVTAAAFYVEIAAPGATEPGAARAWTTIRCRCCDDCRARVERLTRLRLSALPFVAGGVAAWLFALASELPARIIGVSKLEAVSIATLLCAFVVGVPLVALDRASLAVRRCFETSWLLRQLQARVGHPDGKLSHELWRLLPAENVDRAPARGAVIEATELLGSDSFRP